MESWRTSELIDRVRASGEPWLEVLRTADLSAGIYRLAAGAEDTQQPHTEDEVYVVVSGRARFEAGEERLDVASGSVIYVPAGEPHRFLDVVEDLAVLVIFAPPEYSRADTAARP